MLDAREKHQECQECQLHHIADNGLNAYKKATRYHIFMTKIDVNIFLIVALPLPILDSHLHSQHKKHTHALNQKAYEKKNHIQKQGFHVYEK